MNKILILAALVLASCTDPKPLCITHPNQYGETDTIVYDLGVIIMYADTTYQHDTINEIKH